MFRKTTLVIATLLLAFNVAAKGRAVSSAKTTDARLAGGASVTGEVSSVAGNLIRLAGGLMVIDATNAKIFGRDAAATIADVKAGALIVATLQEPAGVSTAPLVATAVAILRNADVTLTGTTQNVDVAGSQLLLLNQSIKVNANTSFVNFGERASIASVQSNMLVIAEANVTGNVLVASRITKISPLPPRPQLASGVVKSVGTDAWMIAVRDRDMTFVVNASTKFLGSPKAGDKVEVLYTVDSANANVALSIMKSIDLPKVVTFNGVVKTIESARWVITRDDDRKDVVVVLPDSVRILPTVRVGDRVIVVATESSDGTYKAISILPRR